jgi:tetratricopeptide (TPR) repeat protein
MSRSRHLVLLGSLLALLATQAWAQSGLMRGEVVDDAGAPLAGVQITVTSEDLPTYRKTLTTDKKGEFKLRFLQNQSQYTFQFLVEKPGYQPFTQPISPSMTQAMNQRFVMEQGETQVVESHGDLGSVVTGSSSAAVESFNAGLTAQREGDLATARAKLEEAIAADPDLGPAQVALAQVLLDQGEYDAAVAAADAGLAMSVSRGEALRVKFQALRALGRGDEADAVALQMEDAEGSALLARRLYNEGAEIFQSDDKPAALAKFREAAALDPALIDAHHAIATIELANGAHEASAAAAERALALGSDDIRTLRVLWDAYDALGRTDELAEIAPRLAAVDPDFGGPKLLEQAANSWNAGQADKAVRLSQLALTIDPDLAKAYYFIGLNHLSSGESDEAKAALQKFLDLAPEDPEAPTAREMLGYIE